jgi:hypothetical protein
LCGDKIPLAARLFAVVEMYGMRFVLIVLIARAGRRRKYANISAPNQEHIMIDRPWNSFVFYRGC